MFINQLYKDRSQASHLMVVHPQASYLTGMYPQASHLMDVHPQVSVMSQVCTSRPIISLVCTLMPVILWVCNPFQKIQYLSQWVHQHSTSIWYCQLNCSFRISSICPWHVINTPEENVYRFTLFHLLFSGHFFQKTCVILCSQQNMYIE